MSNGKPEPASGLAAAVLRVLSERVGQENAIRRAELVERVSDLLWADDQPATTDRAVRDSIADLRLQGWLIANLGTGYFLTNTRAEIEAFLAQERSRARQVEAGLRALERAAETQFAEWKQMGLKL